MLSEAIVIEIKRLLAASQLSQRQIAKTLGVSRGSVQNIACGKRLTRSRHTDEVLSATPARCPQCGSLVYLPCVACRAEAYERRRNDVNFGQYDRPNLTGKRGMRILIDRLLAEAPGELLQSDMPYKSATRR
jgi:transcriptional regulator with XRE-family HTH domain